MLKSTEQFRVLPEHLAMIRMERLAAEPDSGVMTIKLDLDQLVPEPSAATTLESGHRVLPTIHTASAHKALERSLMLSRDLPTVQNIEADMPVPGVQPGLYARASDGKWTHVGD